MDKKEKAMQEKLNERWGCLPITVEQCRTCVWSKGPAPFEDAPEKNYCLVYRKKDIIGKPDDVYHEGAECEYHMTEAEKKAAEERIKKRFENR